MPKGHTKKTPPFLRKPLRKIEKKELLKYEAFAICTILNKEMPFLSLYSNCLFE